MRRFIVVGAHARSDNGFLLNDLAGTSGRLDVLLRCVRAALMVSHGLRRDTVVYLALHGPPHPRCLRFDGSTARFFRPDERSLATLAQKSLAAQGPPDGAFATVRPGISLSERGLDAALDDSDNSPLFLLDETGHDIRIAKILSYDTTFVLGGHRGLDPDLAHSLSLRASGSFSVGPRSVHADDVIAIVSNELDRRAL